MNLLKHMFFLGLCLTLAPSYASYPYNGHSYRVPKPQTLPQAPEGMQGQLPPGHPDISGSQKVMPNSAPDIKDPALPAQKPDFKVSNDWVKEADAGMKQSHYSVSEGDAKAEIYFLKLEGEGGGTLANLNRWRGQIGLPPISDNELPKQAQEVAGSKGKFKLFKVTNPKAKGTAILGAIIPSNTSTIFAKMTGPVAILEKNQKKFLDYCKTVQKTNGNQ